MSRLLEAVSDRLISQKKNYNSEGKWKSTTYEVKCLISGCTNSTFIEKISQLGQKCKKHALINNQNRAKWSRYIYSLHTDDFELAVTNISRKHSTLFLYEEKGVVGNKVKYRPVFKCLNSKCSGISKGGPTLCVDCTNINKKKRPHERTYNKAKLQSQRIRKDGFKIKWKLSYKEFAVLCLRPNCHYCGANLNRAAFRAELGSTSMLLDRKDSNDHYSKSNCVPCCPKCNNTKGQFITYSEMILLMKHRGLWTS